MAHRNGFGLAAARVVLPQQTLTDDFAAHFGRLRGSNRHTDRGGPCSPSTKVVVAACKEALTFLWSRAVVRIPYQGYERRVKTAMQDRAERVTVNLRIKLKYADRGTFEARFAKNISETGIFIRTKKPVPVGTKVRFEYQLADGTNVLRGTGSVIWAKDGNASGEEQTAGIGISFDDIDDDSRGVVQHIVETYGAGILAPTETEPLVVAQAAATEAVTIIDLTGMTPRLISADGRDTSLAAIFEEQEGELVLADEGFIIPEPLLWAGRPGMVGASLHATGLPVIADGAAHRWCPGAPPGGATQLEALEPDLPTMALPEILAASIAGLLRQQPETPADQAVSFLVPPIADDRARQRVVQIADKLDIPTPSIVDAGALLAGEHAALIVQLGHFASAIALYEEGEPAKGHQVLGGCGTHALTRRLALLAELTMLRQHGIDVNDDPSLRDALNEQVERLRRAPATTAPWTISIAGAEVKIEAAALFQFVGAKLRRIVGEALDMSAAATTPPDRICLVYSDGPWPGLHEVFTTTFGCEIKIEELTNRAFSD